MNTGDCTERPFFFGMGFAGSESIRDNDYKEGIILPESAIAKLPPPRVKKELGFNATQVRVQQENHLKEHQDRD